jgi:hypothetical protein
MNGLRKNPIRRSAMEENVMTPIENHRRLSARWKMCLEVVLIHALCLMFLVSAGWNPVVARGKDDAGERLIELAQRFRRLLRERKFDEARAMTVQTPRIWFEERKGEGRPWVIGPTSNDPWSAWDKEFRSRSEVVERRASDRSAIFKLRETNDYHRLLERGWSTVESTYFFDENGKIEGRLIAAVGERSRGRTDDFLEWARTHAPEELKYLMPDGEIDPSGDRPKRFRRLLNRWREASTHPKR